MPSLTPLGLHASALHAMKCLHFSVSRLSGNFQHTISDIQAGFNITTKNNPEEQDRLALEFKEFALAHS